MVVVAVVVVIASYGDYPDLTIPLPLVFPTAFQGSHQHLQIPDSVIRSFVDDEIRRGRSSAGSKPRAVIQDGALIMDGVMN